MTIVVVCILPFPMIQLNLYLDHHVHIVKEISLFVHNHNYLYREPKRKFCFVNSHFLSVTISMSLILF